MTKYRLKKDTPDLEAGEIFDNTDDFGRENSAMFDSNGTYRFDKDDIKHFDEWFEEVQESGWWKPSRGDSYYFINGAGVITSTVWMDNSQDRVRYLMGNCFRTTEAADRFANYLKAIVTVRQDEGVLTPEQINELGRGDSSAYHVGCMTKLDGEKVLFSCAMDFFDMWAPAGAILFDTMEHTDASIKKHPDEWKIIASYDWSRK